jgi:hypothetical protein
MLDGRPAEALAVAFDLFADSSRDALIPLVSALARDLGMIWEIARPGGGAGIAPRDRWRVAKMSALARRIGERRARYGYETAVRAFEALVTGRIDDPRAAIEILTADIAAKVVGPAYR